MRVIQTLITESSREAVVDALESEGLDYAMTDETSRTDHSHVVSVPVEVGDVERIVAKLRDAGIEREGYMVVSDAETIISEHFDERAENEEPDTERISREELRSTAQGLSRSTANYVVFTVVSAFVATAGLLENSAAVVVGSMVIAPLIGPAMASCVGSAIGDDELFWEGVGSQALGLFLAVVSAAVFALCYRLLINPYLDLLVVQQIAERVHPGLLSVAVALGAGVAGALALISGTDEALVGVMIAAALVPPAATVGLGIAYFDAVVAVSATVLLLVNVLSINAVGVLTVWFKRYRPDDWLTLRHARRTTSVRFVSLLVLVLLLTSFLAVGTLEARENAAFERDAERIAESVEGDALSVSVSYDVNLISPNPTTVTVEMSGASDGTATAIADAIRVQTGEEVTVHVIHEDTSVSEERSLSSPSPADDPTRIRDFIRRPGTASS